MKTKNISLIGYSGHAFVCIEIANENGLSINGYYDFKEKEYNPYSLKYLGVDYISRDYISQGKNSELEENIFIAVGDNKIRERIFNEVKEGFSLPSLISKNATISNTAKINSSNLIGTNVIINALANIGNACILNTGCIIEHECIIEDYVHIAPGTVLCGNVHVGIGTFIGANSVVKQGIKIGENVTIGAGSVVIKDIPDNSTYAGNPAKKLD